MMRAFVVIAGAFLGAATLAGQPRDQGSGTGDQEKGVDTLPRRGWFGVALAPHESGARVTAVVDGSSAAAEGIRVGDVIQAVDDERIGTPEEVVAKVARHAGGTQTTIDLVRDGQSRRHLVLLRPMPREAKPGVTFEYGSVALSDGSRLRTILSRPDGGNARLPAVMLIPGGGCGSVDTPMAGDVAQPGLVRDIGTQGFVTMRVEKSGIGDSQGPPCSTIGYTQELEGYRAALAALTRHPSVDTDRIYLLGISLGGVFAPVLAGERSIRGIVVYGTLGQPPSPYPGRSERFFKEFAAVDVAGAWSRVNARVLVLHGEFDEGTAQLGSSRIPVFVNARRPGRAEYRELSGLDHCWTRHESLEKSRDRCGSGLAVSTLKDAILEFLRTT